MWSINVILLSVNLLSIKTAARYDGMQEHMHHQTPFTRIIGGKYAKIWEAKYAAYLEFKDRNQSEWDCSGSLISLNYVLTARHCLFNAINGTVLIGNHDRTTQTSEQIKLSVNVLEHFTVHEEADLALIKLPPYRKPDLYIIDHVDLPPKSSVNIEYENKKARTYGWGLSTDRDQEASDRLRVVEVTVSGACGECYPNETCISGADGKATCSGDSGGPLVIDDYGRDLLIGVTSHGFIPCESKLPSYFVSVNKYLDWLRKNSDAIIPR